MSKPDQAISNKPIGVFDSGVGGLTVARAIMQQIPGYDIVYFGDTAHTPYGTKSPETVKRLTGIFKGSITEMKLHQLMVIISNSYRSVGVLEYRSNG